MTKISFALNTVSDIDQAMHQLGFLRKAFEVITPAQSWVTAQPAATPVEVVVPAPASTDYVEAETVTHGEVSAVNIEDVVLAELIGGKFALRTIDGLAEKLTAFDTEDIEDALVELRGKNKIVTRTRRNDGARLYGAVGRA